MNKSAKFWDFLADKYDKAVSKFKPMFETLEEKCAGYPDKNHVVLDYGCGAGEVTCNVAGYFKEICGIDISSKMIEVARRKAADRNIKNINFEQASIFDDKYKKESFNAVLAFNVLHCVDDANAVTNRINELLKPGGLLLTAIPCIGERSLLHKIFIFAATSIISKLRIFPVYLRFFQFFEFEKLISGNNFRIIETEDMHTSEKHYFIAARKI